MSASTAGAVDRNSCRIRVDRDRTEIATGGAEHCSWSAYTCDIRNSVGGVVSGMGMAGISDSVRMRWHLGLRHGVILRAARPSDHSPIKVATGYRDPACGRTAHVVQAEDRTATQVRNIECCQPVARAERRRDEREQRCIGRAADGLSGRENEA